MASWTQKIKAHGASKQPKPSKPRARLYSTITQTRAPDEETGDPEETDVARKAKKNARPAEQALTTSPEPKANVAYCPPPDELDNSVPELKHLGGSKSDQWNLMLCNQVISTAWYGRNPQPGKDLDDKRTAILAFMAGVNPKDTIEGMMAAQLFASHAAAMECYRRAMLPDQSVEGKQMNLTLAAKLTRANAEQAAALSKYRGKGQQKVVVEHVHVYQGGQAIVGQVTPGGLGKIRRLNPMLLDMQNAPRCGARTKSRNGKPCQSPAMPNGRCRMHGGLSPGAPKGNQNAFKHGRYSAKYIAERRRLTALIREMRDLSIAQGEA